MPPYEPFYKLVEEHGLKRALELTKEQREDTVGAMQRQRLKTPIQQLAAVVPEAIWNFLAIYGLVHIAAVLVARFL